MPPLLGPTQAEISPLGTVGQDALLFETETGAAVNAYIDSTYHGVGSFYADQKASEIEELRRTGTAITKDQYDASPYFRSSLPYSDGLTEEAAKELADYDDAERARNELIANAGTGGTALGMAAALGTGIFEPKNVAYGVATSLALGPVVGAIAPAASRIRALKNIRQLGGQYGARAGLGATEGLVSAALAEPSNRHSAKILQQDYTMSDSLFNVATSTLFGAGFAVAPSFIKDRFTQYRNPKKAADITLREHELAVDQLSTGQRVDVGVVERAAVGEISKKPIAEQTRVVISQIEAETQQQIIPQEANVTQPVDMVAQQESVPAVQWREDVSPRTARDLESPASWVIRNKETGETVMETYNRDTAARINTAKYEAVPALEHLVNLNGQTYRADAEGPAMAQRVRNAAFAGQDVNRVAARLDTQNKASLQKSLVDSVDPLNDTALDMTAVRELEAYTESLANETPETQFKSYFDEVRQMHKDGLISDEEFDSIQQALDSVNEADIQQVHNDLYACLTRG